ncbi:hypothetical protein BU23DRAFT_654644 [Bimuria novae-zelandiae CBS 107.79]|uniref:Uncharacterized protein n=1 Tax=Bimuria novae-zelandiae CBS 107.79 TaxID=1447943 RepID=A0A6A5VR71_9PLEO|nr:hypothetical protein BU23DRAFT_654644 [Bimuria novae-zelandiae CBS 107.79]
MPRPIYPPSPPRTLSPDSVRSSSLDSASSTASQSPLYTHVGSSYRIALNRGNPFLCLPRPVRDRIHALSLDDNPGWNQVEVPDTGDIALRELTEVSPLFQSDITRLLLQDGVWSVSSAAAIYNLLAFLHRTDEGDARIGSKRRSTPTEIEFVGLALWENSSAFSSDAARLFARCPGIKEVRLLVDLRELPFTRAPGYPMIDIENLAAQFDLERLAAVRDLQELKISFVPFMALKRRLGGLEGERLWAGRLRREKGDMREVEGMNGFWGLKTWLEEMSEELGYVCDEECDGIELGSLLSAVGNGVDKESSLLGRIIE